MYPPPPDYQTGLREFDDVSAEARSGSGPRKKWIGPICQASNLVAHGQILRLPNFFGEREAPVLAFRDGSLGMHELYQQIGTARSCSEMVISCPTDLDISWLASPRWMVQRP